MYSFQLYRRKGPFSGSSPESIIGLSSNKGCLTGSSLVPMTTREADDEELLPEPQPTSSPPAAAVPAISLSASRRDMHRPQGDLSLGWNAISINLLSGRRPGQPLPYPSAGTSSRPVPFSPSLCPSASKPNSLAAAPRHISLASSPLTAGSSNSTWSARPSMSADRYVAKRSGSQGPNSPERWPSLTTSAIVLRQRRSSASRLRAASSLRKARDHNSTHSVQYSSLSRRTTGGHASSIKRTSRCEASSMPVSSRKASM